MSAVRSLTGYSGHRAYSPFRSQMIQANFDGSFQYPLLVRSHALARYFYLVAYRRFISLAVGTVTWITDRNPAWSLCMLGKGPHHAISRRYQRIQPKHGCLYIAGTAYRQIGSFTQNDRRHRRGAYIHSRCGRVEWATTPARFKGPSGAGIRDRDGGTVSCKRRNGAGFWRRVAGGARCRSGSTFSANLRSSSANAETMPFTAA